MSSSRGALFGSGGGGRQSKNLVEFRAGKMTQKGKMVHPDKRKGLLYVYQADDSLIHLCWKDRQSGTVEDDLIIFPEDCEYKRVNQCTTGRVYILKFKSSNRIFFFWMQEPKTDKDDELCKKVNEVLNNPPTPGSSRSGGVTPDGDLQSLLNTMSQQQLMQFFGNVGQIGNLSSLLGPTGAGGRPSASSRSSAASGATTTASSAAPATDQAVKSEPKASDQQPKETNVDLASSLTVENLQAMLADPETVRELQKHLPAMGESGASTESEQLRSTLQSPQFQQAVSMFSAALQSGQLGPVVQQFEVGSDAVNAANQGDLEEFVRSLQKAKKGSESPKDDEMME